MIMLCYKTHDMLCYKTHDTLCHIYVMLYDTCYVI